MEENSQNKDDYITIYIDGLYAYLRKFQLSSALVKIGEASKVLYKLGPLEKQQASKTTNEWQLAFLAKSLIRCSNDYRKQRFGDKELVTASLMYNSLYEKLINEEINEKLFHEFFIRLSYQQFPFQAGINYLIPRTLFLFDEIVNALPKDKIDIPKAILDIYGMTIKEIIVIGLGLFIKAGGYLDPSSIYNIEGDLKRHFNKESVERLILTMTSDYKELRQAFDTEIEEDGAEQYSFNALRNSPIVKTDIDGLVIPVPIFIFEKITKGIYFGLMDYFRNESGNPFLEFFGKEIFEKYVGILLSEVPKEKLISEFSYIQGDLSPDWVILEDDAAILIECKTSGITKESKTSGDINLVQIDLKKRVIHALEQLYSFKNKCIKENTFKNISKYYYVVVTFDRIYLSGTPAIKDIIDKELSKKEITIDYEILGIEELEILAPYIGKVKLRDILDQRKKETPSDFDVFFPKFLENNKIGEIKNQILRNKFDSFIKEINPNFKIKD